MFKPEGKLTATVRSAAESIREAASSTGKLVIAALAVASGALLLAAAAFFLVFKMRKVSV